MVCELLAVPLSDAALPSPFPEWPWFPSLFVVLLQSFASASLNRCAPAPRRNLLGCLSPRPTLLVAVPAIHSFSTFVARYTQETSVSSSSSLTSLTALNLLGNTAPAQQKNRPFQLAAAWIHGRISNHTANSLAANSASATRSRSRQCLLRPPFSRVLRICDSGSTTKPARRRKTQHRHDPEAPQTQISAIFGRQWHRSRRHREKGLDTQRGTALVWKEVQGRHSRSTSLATRRSAATWLS